eukprot:CAMPEP_0197614030 /NCGR_PEP_ID=MMETSP1326-20131121/59318_1 /TAXON_ID=1155430 /ORGANISM="Genus nov. species nov., Strain RCC2288" /LENGTH=216 /DNA_ID=CAMNT_0043182899 /DNA_START=1011 /DNA_END=1662 /DNA_ORIENTATION=-
MSAGAIFGTLQGTAMVSLSATTAATLSFLIARYFARDKVKAEGTAMVSLSATTAATLSFLIARYFARDKVKALADKNPKFAAIDRAIGADSFKVVMLLRLSPLFPFAVGNYLYGLTSVKTKPYVIASWLGMLPGTFAFVSAGAVGRTLIDAAGDTGAAVGAADGSTDWGNIAQVGAGFGFAVLSSLYIARLASNALKEVGDDMDRSKAEADRARTK